MQCRSSPLGVWRTRSPKKVHEVLRPGRVGDPPGDATVVDVEGGEEDGGPVALVFELPARRLSRDGWLGRVDSGLGLHPRLLVHAPDHGIVGGIEVETAHVGGLLPEVRVMAGHPGLHLPGLEVQALQIRQAWEAEMGTPWSAMASASASMVQRVASSGGGSVTNFTKQQHVVVVIDRGTARSLLI